MGKYGQGSGSGSGSMLENSKGPVLKRINIKKIPGAKKTTTTTTGTIAAADSSKS